VFYLHSAERGEGARIPPATLFSMGFVLSGGDTQCVDRGGKGQYSCPLIGV
jgi:hypothetical protein